mgnify:CR=1 FL=1
MLDYAISAQKYHKIVMQEKINSTKFNSLDAKSDKITYLKKQIIEALEGYASTNY